MDTERAIEIVQALADGVDPYSGERFPSDSPYQLDFRYSDPKTGKLAHFHVITPWK